MKRASILAIPGSLRSNSSTTAIIKQIIRLDQEEADITVYRDLAHIPPFDDSPIVPPIVREFKSLIAHADAVLICTPEYAFGVPGVLKNALDWTVGTGEFVNKRVGVITAATGGSYAHASLLLTLSALSARIVDHGTMLIAYVRSKLSESGEITDKQILKRLNLLISSLANAPVAVHD